MARRRRHTKEFKRDAVRLMETRGDRTIADVAESLGVAENLLHNWRKAYSATTGIRRQAIESPEDELKRLRREVAQLKRDNAMLIKVSAYFARAN
jgi:transposase